MTIFDKTIDAYEYIEILDDFIITSNENWFVDEEVIFQDNNESGHGAKRDYSFFQERYIKPVTLTINSRNFNSIENS